MNWWIKCIKDYVNFNGRARRTEYWMFALFNFIFSIAALILDIVLGLRNKTTGYGTIQLLYTLFIFLPQLAAAVRRLHDIGKSGAWYLVNFIPLVGWIWFIVLMCTDGNPNTNQYGPNPKLPNPDDNLGSFIAQ